MLFERTRARILQSIFDELVAALSIAGVPAGILRARELAEAGMVDVAGKRAEAGFCSPIAMLLVAGFVIVGCRRGR